MIQLNSDSIKVKENGQWSSLASLTGPQGEKGETGATGSQGPQGIPGVPGYPTISAGDAGKVLTVNSNEDAVEWAETVAGIEVWDVTNRLDSYLTVDELAKVNEIPNGYRLFLEYNGIFFIQDEYWNYGDHNIYNFYEAHGWGSGYFYINTRKIEIDGSNGYIGGIYGNETEVFSYGMSGAADGVLGSCENKAPYSIPVIKTVNGNMSSGWASLPRAGAGLVNNAGLFDMSVPVVKEENMVPGTLTFDSSIDTYNAELNYNEAYFDTEHNATKCNELYDGLNINKPTTVNIDINYTYEGVSYSESITCTNVRYEPGSWQDITFGHVDSGDAYLPTGIRGIWYRADTYAVPNDGLEVQFDTSNFSVSSISIYNVPLPTGTYTYTSQLPIEAIECNQTTAGTYTLQCVVDAQGNKTYSWV